MKKLKLLATAWLVMWGLSYIVTALSAPWIAGYNINGALLYTILGALILSALLFHSLDRFHTFVRVLFFILGSLTVVAGVRSWTGLTVWNVPFENLALFQVSMASADMLSAVFMFTLVFGEEKV